MVLPQIACGLTECLRMHLQPGVGNSAPIDSLTQCLIACETAPGCSAVAYSPGDRNCFLKGCPSQYAITCPVRILPSQLLWLASYKGNYDASSIAALRHSLAADGSIVRGEASR